MSRSLGLSASEIVNLAQQTGDRSLPASIHRNDAVYDVFSRICDAYSAGNSIENGVECKSTTGKKRSEGHFIVYT